MRATSGRCLFCGGEGLSKGHVWPKWVRKLLPNDVSHHEQVFGQFYSFSPRLHGNPSFSTRTRQGHAGSRRPRNTCVKCNTGWMSRIEDYAKHFAAPLMSGQPIFISPTAQFALASFFCLMAIRFELLGEDVATPEEERTWLRKNKVPSKNWQVWIAKFSGDDSYSHWAKSYGAYVTLSPPSELYPEKFPAHVSTMVLGELLIHMFYCEFLSFHGNYWTRLCKIWPPSQYTIDSRLMRSLGDSEVVTLHEKFAKYLDSTVHGVP